MIKEPLSWDPLRPRSRSSLCITAVKCALLCVWGLGFRTLFFLKYQTDQSCICSGESRGRWFSVHIFTRLFLDRTLGKYPAAQTIPRVLLCFHAFSFFLFLASFCLSFFFSPPSDSALWQSWKMLEFSCMSQKQRLAAQLWTRCHNVPSYKPVSLCSHYSTSLCPFRNQNAEFNHLGWNIEWAKEAFHHL